MTRAELIYFNAGGGHRAAAAALAPALERLPSWQVRRTNLFEMLDPGALFKRLTGFQPEDLYNKRLSSGFTLGLEQELKLLQASVRLCHGGLVRRLARHWQVTRPDIVVSLIPNFNRCMHDALALSRPGAPFVTVMTDMADHPPRFWAEPGTAQHLVCGTEHAARQALAAGCAPHRVHRVDGMLLRPEFHAPPAPGYDRTAARLAAGLDADTPSGLVLFGGAGSPAMQAIANSLSQVPLVLLCGRNEALATALRALPPGPAPRIVLGHTGEVAHWMRLADFFIGKPGPGSLSEAVQQGLPVVTVRNAWTMPQERWNTDWVQQHGVGVVARSFRRLGAAVTQLQNDMPAYRARVAAMHNDALLQVPRLIAGLREQAPQHRESVATA